MGDRESHGVTPLRGSAIGADRISRARDERYERQRERVRDHVRGDPDPEVGRELAFLADGGVFDTWASLDEQRVRWQYLEALWVAAGRPTGTAEKVRRALASVIA